MRFGRKTIERRRITLAHISFILACAVRVTTLETFANPNANARRQSANESSASATRQPTVAIFRKEASR